MYYPRPQDKYRLLHHRQKQNLPQMLECLTTLLRQYDAHSVLDCSCGRGLYSVALAREGFQVTAADASEQLLAEAKQYARDSGVQVSFHLTEIDQLPALQMEKFDAAICLNSDVSRVDDEQHMYASVSAVLDTLKEDGIFSLTDLGRYFGDEVSVIDNLLKGETIAEKRSSLIRVGMFHDYMDYVLISYIYHVEDLASSNVEIDTEGVKQLAQPVKDGGAWDIFELTESYLYKELKIGEEAVFVCSPSLKKINL